MDFQAKSSSIGYESKGESSNLIFKRPIDFCKGEYSIFPEKLCAESVVQGSLGDCYLMSSLAVLTETPG